MLQISGPSGDLARLFVQAFVISVLDSRTPSWLRLPDASSARRSRCGGPSVFPLGWGCQRPSLPVAIAGVLSCSTHLPQKSTRAQRFQRLLCALPEVVGRSLKNLDELGETANLSRVMVRTAQSCICAGQGQVRWLWKPFQQLFLLTCYINVCLLSIWWEQTARSTFNQEIVCSIYK